MRTLCRIAIAALVYAGLSGPAARAGVVVGVGIGYRPGYCYRPYWGGYYYRPYFPIVVGVPPLVVGTAPVVQPVTVVQPAPVQVLAPAPGAPPPAQVAPPLAPTQAAPPGPAATITRAAPPDTPADAEQYLHQLGTADERTRAEAAIQLGRLRDSRAVEPLKQILTTDRSPVVRESAARGLGLIGAPASLTALQMAAQADDDREVRSSARFAADAIRSQMPR